MISDVKHLLMCLLLLLLSHFSHVQLFGTLRTVAHQAPLSMGFSRLEYWSGSPCPPPGDLPDPRDRTCVSWLLHCQAGSLPLAPPIFREVSVQVLALSLSGLFARCCVGGILYTRRTSILYQIYDLQIYSYFPDNILSHKSFYFWWNPIYLFFLLLLMLLVSYLRIYCQI